VALSSLRDGRRTRDARWFLFRPKIPFWEYLEGLGMENVDINSGHLGYFITIGYIKWAFGNFEVIWYIFAALVYCTKKNLATIRGTVF
jgi:hypothetical protein